MKLKLGLLGGSGRMGTMVQTLVGSPEFKSRFEWVCAPAEGEPLDELLGADLILDFSLPKAAVQWIRFSNQKKHPLPMVVGSTGWTTKEKMLLNAYSKKTLVLQSSNFSLGVCALKEILRLAAPLMKNLNYNPVLIEKHHRHKKDSPSGTAKSILEITGSAQTHAIRAGEIIGDHEVTFYGPSDHVTIGHSANDRAVFARGAIDACLWLHQISKKKSVGLFTMDDFFRSQIKKHKR